MKMIQCYGCDLPILDRFLFNVLDRPWHKKCVQCIECKLNLSEKCFTRDGKLYCRNDFFRLFGTKCSGCAQGILPTDLVRRARNKVFHLKCFTCLVCRKQLSTGEELYILDENRFVCKEDYMTSRHSQVLTAGSPAEPDLDDNIVSPPELDIGPHGADSDHDDDNLLGMGPLPSLGSIGHGSGHHSAVMSSKSSPMSASSSMSDSGISGPNGTNGGTDPTSPTHASGSNSAGNEENQPGGTKRRGPRTTIKAKQLETLKAAFAATPKPTRHIREQLAQETGLNMRVIQVWFQNRRSKERRMKQLSSLGARRHFFRSPRRAMRPLRPGLSPDGLEDSPEMVGGPNNGFGYFSDSSNPSDFQYGVPTQSHNGPPGPGFYDFFPGQGPPVHGPDGMVPAFMSGPHPGHPAAPGNIHHPGSINLAADAPFVSGAQSAPAQHADLMAAQQRATAPSPGTDGMNLPPLTPDTYGRPSSTIPTVSETPVW